MSTPTAGFESLGLHPKLLQTLTDLGYEDPTPIQAEAIPQMLSGTDLLGQAATGTGKTAAFALPIISGLEHRPQSKHPVALVLVPTRELCMQVSGAMHRYGKAFGARTLPVYGGQPIGRQISELRRGVDIVVATPGRALDHLNRGTLNLDDVATVVLDEADEMLDMGFAEDIEAILSAAPAQRQTVLFSATMPRRIMSIADAHLDDPVRVEIAREVPAEGQGPKIEQTAYIVSRAHKVAALGRILDMEQPLATLVFCRTRDEVDQLTETLNGRGYRAEALHGGMDQRQRDRVMGKLRSQSAELLVATDVAARGLDVEHLTHVVNYDVPSSPESYVHRIGRVGRGDRQGVAITIAEPREQRYLKIVQRVTKQQITIAKVPSSADLRALRLESTRARLYESCLDDDLDNYRVVLDSLTDDFDVVQVALAAIKTAHTATVPPGDDADIPQPEPRKPKSRTHDEERPKKRRKDSKHAADGGERKRGSGKGKQTEGREEHDSSRGTKGKDRPKGRGRGSAGYQRVFINSGRSAGVRPQDVVGAIANETEVSGRDIGDIQIADRFSTVEVPSGSAKQVIAALSRTRLKGNRVKARLDRHKG